MNDLSQPLSRRDFLTLAEFQQRVPVTRRTIFTWRKDGWLPAVDTGGKILFHWPSCEAALLRRQKGGLQ
jgi:hypothetical protein